MQVQLVLSVREREIIPHVYSSPPLQDAPQVSLSQSVQEIKKDEDSIDE